MSMSTKLWRLSKGLYMYVEYSAECFFDYMKLSSTVLATVEIIKV